MTMMGRGEDAEEFLIAASQQEDDETTRKNCILGLQKLQVCRKWFHLSNTL